MMSKLIPTKEAFQVVDFGLSSIRQTTHGIRKALGKDIRRARKAKVDKRNFEDAIVLTTDPKSFYNRSKTGFTKIMKAQQIRSWGDCYGYLAVACGRADIMIDDVINPWDISAASIIVTESGGKFSTWDGVSLLGKDAIATNGLLHTELVEMLK